uniref:Sec15 domain-containing protein n=1 Tax=Caenorhabditis tropicalis TaxID=1561998 RepID=A0A1I7TR38_9PELO
MSSSSTSQQATSSTDTVPEYIFENVNFTDDELSYLYKLETSDMENMKVVLREIYDTFDIQHFSRAMEQLTANYEKDDQQKSAAYYRNYFAALEQLKAIREQYEDDEVEVEKQILRINANRFQRREDLMRDRGPILLNISEDPETGKRVSLSFMHYPELSNQQHSFNCKLSFINSISVKSGLHLICRYNNPQQFARNLKYYNIRNKTSDPLHLFHEKNIFKAVQELIGPWEQRQRDGNHESLYTEIDRIGQVLSQQNEKYFRLRLIRNREVNDIEYSDYLKTIEKVELMETPTSYHRSTLKYARKAIRMQAYRELHFFLEELVEVAEELEPFAVGFNPMAPLGLDFEPVERCKTLFIILKSEDSFHKFWLGKRREQCGAVILPPFKLDNYERFQQFLSDIVKFFAVDFATQYVERNLIKENEMWEEALPDICNLLVTGLESFSDVQMLLDLNNLILYFARAIRPFGCIVMDPLYDLVKRFWDRYNELLVKDHCLQFERDLPNHDYTRITISGENVKDPERKKLYPRTLPFSHFFASTQSHANRFIKECVEYSSGLQLSQTVIADTARKSVNALFVRWAEILKKFIGETHSVFILVQIGIDLGYIAEKCGKIGYFDTEKTTREKNEVVLSVDVFLEVRKEIQPQIIKCMRTKIDEIIESANYDWERPATSGETSDFITKLISCISDELDSSLMNMHHLSAKFVYQIVFDDILQSLWGLMFSPSTKFISTGALNQFSLDLMQCEAYASICPVSEVEPQAFSTTFADLRQLLDLVIFSDWTTFIAEYGKNEATYSTVKPKTAIVVLEKMIAYERKCPTEGDREKSLDGIVQQLKLLR